MTNPYSVLGVKKSADEDTIRKAYKKLARKYHPDVSKHPRAEEKFKEINSAYDVLGDAEKRKLYDQFGDVSLRPGFNADQARAWSNMGGGNGGMPFNFGGGGVDVDDLLGSLFGGGGGFRNRRPRRGPDQSTELRIDFMSSVLGGERTIQIRQPDGTVDTLRVPIPAGAKDGGRVRLKGKGLPPPGGGPCGDLLVTLRVGAHPTLRRVDDNLEMDVPITVLEALQGASITVPTPTGDVKLSVPAGAKSGTRLRIKGRGVQKKRPGHLYLILRPTVPVSDDPEVIAAAERLEQAYDGVRDGLKL